MARYLSRADLSHIAGKYIDQYYTRFGISKDDPEPIDPERLASSVLGLNVKMLPLGIDRVLAVKHGTSRLGGKGHCFTCLICGQKRNLWLERGKWFVEAYCSVPESCAS